MSWILPPWDAAGTQAGRLPEWAVELRRRCRRYEFTTTQVYSGRSVVARRVSGTGPELVITRSEAEMRLALGLKPRKPAP